MSRSLLQSLLESYWAESGHMIILRPSTGLVHGVAMTGFDQSGFVPCPGRVLFKCVARGADAALAWMPASPGVVRTHSHDGGMQSPSFKSCPHQSLPRWLGLLPLALCAAKIETLWSPAGQIYFQGGNALAQDPQSCRESGL